MNALEKNFKLKLSKEHAKLLLEQLKKDCKFFEECSIIDYSLLIGVHKIVENRIESINFDQNESASFEFMSLRNSIVMVINEPLMSPQSTI